MNKYLAYGCLMAALGMGLTGCSDENPWADNAGQGTLRLNLSASADVVDAVPATRASGDTELITAPDPAEFRIQLDKNDGSYSKEWGTPAQFANETGFKTGSYVISAVYGDPAEEGFEKPCFSGSAPVTVLESHETEVSLTATLANSMVSVDYTDAFRSYFKDFSSTVHSEGHSYVEYTSDEKRPAFIAPGDVKMTVSVTDRQGRTVQVQPAEFVAEARHHYHVTLDVNNGQTGTARLVVSFDESVMQDDIFIDLTDELFSSPAPTVSLSEGYADGDVIEALQFDTLDSPLKFSVMARGGLASAVLTVNSEEWTPAFGHEIDLVGANSSQQTLLAEAGVKAVGFYNNPDKMGMVDLSDFVAALPPGRHTVTLVAKDRFMRVSDPVSVTFDTNAVNIKVTPSPTIFGSYRASLAIEYNGRDFEDAFTFKAEDNYGGFADCSIISCEQRARSRSFETRTYDVVITRPVTERDIVKVKVFYHNNEVAEVEVPVIVPSYSVVADAFSNRVVLKVSAAESEAKLIVESLNVYLNGEKVEDTRLTRDTNQGLIYVAGLSPNTTYALSTTLTTTPGDAENITTEAAAAIPNGNFSATTQTINMTGVQIGGQYKVSPVSYTLKTSIVRSEANGWGSLNPYTCWTGSSNKNTWFVVPSTFVENGVATIRSVGFNHSGTTPAASGGAFNTTYYCTNAPTFGDNNKSIGMMFLGSSSYDGGSSITRNEGVAFKSRPKSLSFEYSYTSLNSEKGQVTIEVLDASGNVIGKGSLDLGASSSMKAATVAISSYKFGTKPATLRICFKSSTAAIPAINIPTGGDLNEKLTLGNHTTDANQYKAVAVGSELKVTDLKLNY